MIDLPGTGAFYNRSNKQDPMTRVYSRLDRCLANQEWFNCFPDMVAHFYSAGLFDHCPCTVSNVKLDSGRRASFKFFNIWGDAPSFLSKVQEEWQQHYPGYKMFNVVKKLKNVKSKLKELNKECFSDIENKASIAEKDLLDVQLQIKKDPQNVALIQKENQIFESLKVLSKARTGFLQQKAKIEWMEDGDSNTAYFHGAIKKRCTLNKVTQIED
ncbi:uncharacterized protein LOC141588305 [Silene latifolia]|uniref:uncharacterized protein LOC141588305 n=1 Tax=Silene latifolia TaxID=37657 RepID=UPI003D779802